MTKNQLLSQMKNKIDQQTATSAKQFMTENLKSCILVWQSFEKFIHN